MGKPKVGSYFDESKVCLTEILVRSANSRWTNCIKEHTRNSPASLLLSNRIL